MNPEQLKEIMEQVEQLPPEVFAEAIKQLPPIIRNELRGETPLIRKALALLGIESVELEPYESHFNEVALIMGYLPDMIIGAALKQWQEKEAGKPEANKAPKGLPPFDANGLGRMPTDHYVAEHLGAQMLAGKGWPDKQGGWESNPQGPPSIHKDHSNGGRIHITLSGREFDAAEHAAGQIQAAVHATMERYGALSVDVTLYQTLLKYFII